MEVFEVRLPGVGVRYEFTTGAGDRLGVVVRRDGRRELLVYDELDPDSCRSSVELTAAESAAFVELMGGSKVTERISDMRHEVEGLSIEWVTMPPTGGLTGKSIGHGQIRTHTGASIVAVLRGDMSHPGPGPQFVLCEGDVALVTGTVEGVIAPALLTGRTDGQPLRVPTLLAAGTSGIVLIELGAVLLVLAVLRRLAARVGRPSIPLYLLAGLLLGEGSAIPLDASEEFIRVSADVGVVLLLLLLGLEYRPDELTGGLRSNGPAGAVDFVGGFLPGYVLGIALGWDQRAAALLGAGADAVGPARH